MAESSSSVANFSRIAGGVGVLAFVLGPALIQIGVLSPFVGFRLFMFGGLLGFVALISGAIGLWLTRSGAGRAGRSRAVVGSVLGLGIVAVVAVSAGAAVGLPPINDITTDPDDPPNFAAVRRLEANVGRELGYPGESFASAQRAAYPDLAPIHLDAPPAQALERARATADALGWEIVAVDPDNGTLEALDVTRVFRFVDDVIVRVRPAEGGARLDVRSKSRDGRGDIGANAARIRAFRDAITR